MRNRASFLKRAGTLVVAAALIWPAASCAGSTGETAGGATPESTKARTRMFLDGTAVGYHSVARLAFASDLIVVGRLHDPTPTTMGQRSVPRDEENRTPMNLWKVDVKSVLKGEAPAELIVSRFDLHNPDIEIVADDIGDTTADETAVLFLKEGFDGVYYVAGVDQGFVDVDAQSRLHWRTGNLVVKPSGSAWRTTPPDRALPPADPPTTSQRTIADSLGTLDQLKQAISDFDLPSTTGR